MKDKNIFEKMSLITDEIGVVEKNLNVAINKNASYKAVSERDILDAVKPIEKKYGVYSYPVEREIVDSDTLVKESEYNGATTKTNTLYMRLKTTYRFVNIDKPEEFIDITTYGDGLDTGDKATGKAMTYADKYALMKAYKISTGDDPDKEASPETGYQRKERGATESQITKLQQLYTEEELEKFKSKKGINDISEFTVSEASNLIGYKLKK